MDTVGKIHQLVVDQTLYVTSSDDIKRQMTRDFGSTTDIPTLKPITTPIAPILTLVDTLLGDVLGYCERCSDPIFEADDLDCYHYNSESGYRHGRCEYAAGSMAPKGYWSTNDLADQLRQAGIDPRTRKEIVQEVEVDLPQCYICGTDDPEDEITKVELPNQIVDVCGRCEISYQHQEMVRQEYGLAESEI